LEYGGFEHIMSDDDDDDDDDVCGWLMNE